MKQIKLLKERERYPVRPANTQPRAKRKRDVLTGPKAKKTPTKRTRSIANTRQRSGRSLIVAVKAGRRAGGRKAGKRDTSIKVMRKEAAQKAKTSI